MLRTKRIGEWFQILVPHEWAGKSIDEIFHKVWEASKKLTYQFRVEHKVLVDGSRINWNSALPLGAKLQLHLFEDEQVQTIPNFFDLEILYEDDHILVINKPPFMNTHPNDPTKDTDSLINAAAYYLLSKGEMRNIRQIHRLDRDTSGAILFAKHALAGGILDKMLEKREVKRTYIAAVHGIFQQKSGSINKPIGRDRHHATRRRVSASGQEAITHYQLLKVDTKKKLSYVKCWLDTGRTHQIRVHLSHLGHPLVGDTLYGGMPVVNRQALHAVKLEFFHPFIQEVVVCHAPFMDLPELFNHIDVYSI